MKNTVLILSILLVSQCLFAQQKLNIVVNGKSHSILEGQLFSYTTNRGEKLSIKVLKDTKTETSSDTKLYKDQFVQFTYPTSYFQRTNRLSSTVNHIGLKNKLGGGVFIQEFISLNPELIVDDVLVSLLGGVPPSNFSGKTITLANNKRLKGKSTIDFDGQEITVLAAGENKRGVLVVIIGGEEDSSLIELVKSMTIK